MRVFKGFRACTQGRGRSCRSWFFLLRSSKRGIPMCCTPACWMQPYRPPRSALCVGEPGISCCFPLLWRSWKCSVHAPQKCGRMPGSAKGIGPATLFSALMSICAMNRERCASRSKALRPGCWKAGFRRWRILRPRSNVCCSNRFGWNVLQLPNNPFTNLKSILFSFATQQLWRGIASDPNYRTLRFSV
ncbi:hypothetical protein D3C73_538510 [compost metagenome]